MCLEQPKRPGGLEWVGSTISLVFAPSNRMGGRARYARAVYEAAALAVEAALKRLIQEGFYRRVELEEALAMVAKAAWELPNSMVSLLMGAPPSTVPAARSALRSLLLSSAEP